MFYHPAGFLVTWAHDNIGLRIMFLTILKIIFWQWLPASNPWWLSRAHRIKSKLLIAAPEALPFLLSATSLTHCPQNELFPLPECVFPKLSPAPTSSSLRSQLTSHHLLGRPHLTAPLPPVSSTSPFFCIELSHFWYDLAHLFAYLNIIYLPVNCRRPKDY